MKNRNIIFITILLVLGCVALSPVGQARQQSEDRGSGNSAAENVQALNLSTTGSNNTAHGWFSLFSNTTGSSNTADGFQALYSNTEGGNNTAYGFQALYSNAGSLDRESGSFNTALGYQAMYSNSGDIFHLFQCSYNTAVGYQALYSNTIGDEFAGSFNTAVGYQALYSNTTSGGNTAIGYLALYKSTTPLGGNTAVGEFALANNTTGYSNTAMGDVALNQNSTGANNTAIGHFALEGCTTGSQNTALGENAGANVTTANNVICIGSEVHGDNVANTTWVGNIYGVTVSGTTAPVVVSDTGQLGTMGSSERFKKDIRTIQNASEAILSLRPVSFHYKSDAKNIPQFGLIAEEVAKVNPALVALDKDGKPYSVRYDAVNAMLLNEFLKEHRKVQELEATVGELKKGMETVVARLKEQDSKIQKVGSQVELSKAAPRIVLNNP
jgi:hypothetical protein